MTTKAVHVDDRPAVLIGAGGLGMAIGRRLAQRRRVLVADIDGARATEVAHALQEEGGEAIPVTCDATRPESVEELAEMARAEGGLGPLVHVAGLSPNMAGFADIVRVNLIAPTLVTRAFLPLAGPGSVAVVIASLAAHTAPPTGRVDALLRQPIDTDSLTEELQAELGPEDATSLRAYQLSKYGLLVLARHGALAWGQRGARIVSLSPGLIATPMGAFETERNELRRQRLTQIPLGRQGSMHEIADGVEFLISDRASFISGIDLRIDGGIGGRLAEEAARETTSL